MGSIFVFNAALLFVLIIGLWLYSLKIEDVSFIDAFWAFGMVILAASTFIQLGSPDNVRPLLITALTAIWGLRLSFHLYTRWLAHGVDPRYARILGGLMDKKGWSFAKSSLLQVFLLQAPLLYIVCLPAQLGQIEAEVPLGPFAYLGTFIALVGISFESIGDAQLKAFKANPSNSGKVLDTGLWRYTRHPNYFGDCCTWWGIYLIAAETMTGLWSLPGPALLTFLLVKWSGVPLLERGLAKTKHGYADYIARTSSFFPWPPKQ
jgi:steroid 5-alpha reductase family enzyme